MEGFVLRRAIVLLAFGMSLITITLTLAPYGSADAVYVNSPWTKAELPTVVNVSCPPWPLACNNPLMYTNSISTNGLADVHWELLKMLLSSASVGVTAKFSGNRFTIITTGSYAIRYDWQMSGLLQGFSGGGVSHVSLYVKANLKDVTNGYNTWVLGNDLPVMLGDCTTTTLVGDFCSYTFSYGTPWSIRWTSTLTTGHTYELYTHAAIYFDASNGAYAAVKLYPWFQYFEAVQLIGGGGGGGCPRCI